MSHFSLWYEKIEKMKKKENDVNEWYIKKKITTRKNIFRVIDVDLNW
jgi:hypothetical protein